MRVIVDNLILLGMALLLVDSKSPKEIQVLLLLGSVGYAAFPTILEKLELRDRTQLAIFYYRHK